MRPVRAARETIHLPAAALIPTSATSVAFVISSNSGIGMFLPALTASSTPAGTSPSAFAVGDESPKPSAADKRTNAVLLLTGFSHEGQPRKRSRTQSAPGFQHGFLGL